MWILSNTQKCLLYRITPGKQHIVSRKGGDLLLLDQSVSRKHAQLYIKAEIGKESVIVIDFASKYGTFVTTGGGENTRISPNEPVALQHGDIIKFGVLDHMWRVEHIPLLVTTSVLPRDVKNEVKDFVYSLGGKVVDSWQPECTHLTMTGLTVTVKVVCALAHGRAIVTPAYWRAITEQLDKMQGPFPEIKAFTPPLQETSLINVNDISFLPNPDRRKLFSGMTFVAATSKQLKRIESMVTAAGGKAVQFGTSKINVFNEGVVLMQHSASDEHASQPSQLSQTYLKTEKAIKAANLRCIPESDIGLSVVYCSVAHYCNPKFSHHKILLRLKSPSQPTQRSAIIVPETQEEPILHEAAACIEVPETCPLTVDSVKKRTTYKKRSREDENECAEGCSKTAVVHPSSNSEDLFQSECNNESVHTSSTSNLDQHRSKKSLQFEVTKKPRKDVPDDDPFGFPLNMNINKLQSSGQTDEDMFAFTGQKSRCLSRKRSEDMFSSISTNNKKDQPSIKCSVDMFASSGQSKKRSREDDIDFSLHLEQESGPTEEENNFDISGIALNKKKKAFKPNKFHKKAKVDENDPFAFPNQMGNVTVNNTGDVFDFPVNIDVDNLSTHNQFDSEALDFNRDNEKDGNTFVQIKPAISTETKNPITNYMLGGKKVSVEWKKTNSAEQDTISTDSVSKQEPKVEERDISLCNFDNIQFKNLTISKPTESRNRGSQQQPYCKNFKKFCKVPALNKSIVPHIIGGSDVFVYEGNIKVKTDWIKEPVSEDEDVEW